eukprot:1629161-Rhodomonas_salina.1
MTLDVLVVACTVHEDTSIAISSRRSHAHLARRIRVHQVMHHLGVLGLVLDGLSARLGCHA